MKLFGWKDIGLSALLMLVVAVPTMAVEEDWHGRPMIDQPGHLWVVPAFLVVAAFLVGGALVGYRRPSASTLNALAAASIALAVLLAGALVRRYWIAHENLPLAVLHLWGLGVVVALVLSIVGARVGRRLSASGR